MTLSVIECTSSVEQVTVYARGAMVTRLVSLPPTLPGEPVELQVRGLTPLAEATSLRAVLDGEREVVALRSALVVPALPSDPGLLAERVRALGLECRELARQRAHLENRRQALAPLSIDPLLRARWRELDPVKRIDDALAADALLGEQLAELDRRLRDLDETAAHKQRELEAAELAAAQARSAELAGAGHPTVEVRLRLAAGEGAVRRLSLVYAIAAARWWPAYRAYLDAAEERAEWTLEAFVAQLSGEDWSDVRLTLSTADLVHDARLPELPSLRLGRAQAPARKGYRPPPQGLDVLFAGYDRAVARLALPAPATGAERGAVQPSPQVQPAHLVQLLASPAEEKESTACFDGLVTAAEALPADAPQSSCDDETGAVPEGALGGAAGPMNVAASTALPGGVPPPCSAPCPSPPMPSMPVGAGFATAARSDTVCDQPAPQPMMRSRGRMESAKSKEIGLRPGKARPAAPPPPSAMAIEPADAWLDFDSLVLADPGEASRRGRLVREAGDARGAASDRARQVVEQVAAPPYARDPRSERGQFDHRYDAVGLCDVPSDARLHRVAVGQGEASLRFCFRAAPLEAAEVYREAELRSPFPTPLLGGPVEVFLDGTLTSTSAMGPVDRGGTIRLGLGVEDRLRIARNARIQESSAGLLGGSTAIEHLIAIDLSSALGRKVTVEVIDRAPVSDSKEVEIERLPARPKAESYDQAERGQPIRGGLRWQVEVAAGAKAQIEHGYRISISSKDEIIGGNRREP